MAFKRVQNPQETLTGEALTSAMVGIGMAFAARPMSNPNIEDTLFAASIDGMEHDDLRVLAVLMNWIEIHGAWINVDRLTVLVGSYHGKRVQAFWSAVALWLSKDRRFMRLAKVYDGPTLDLLASGTAFHLHRSGEDARFAGGPLRVPAGILRERLDDVLSPEELACRHDAYRHRIMLGPSYRADMWASLERESNQSVSELARHAYGSFATAWHVKRDWEVLRRAETAKP